MESCTKKEETSQKLPILIYFYRLKRAEPLEKKKDEPSLTFSYLFDCFSIPPIFVKLAVTKLKELSQNI